LLEAKLTNGTSQIILAVKSGKLVRFEESKTRPMGRTVLEFVEFHLKMSLSNWHGCCR
jgi:DNA gyrase/topoisomerase IV subunit A